MKLIATQLKGRYVLELEPGDTVDIEFDPGGVNAVPDGNGNIHALTIGTTIMPGASMALSFWFSDTLYKNKPLAGASPSLYAYRNYGAFKLEFTLQEEMPHRTLTLEKINLGKLLEEHIEPC